MFGRYASIHYTHANDLTVSIQINEAFASQFAYCVEQLQIPIEKINPKYVLSSVSYSLVHERRFTVVARLPSHIHWE